MFCTKCGAKLEEGAKYCDSCGAKVEEEPGGAKVEEETGGAPGQGDSPQDEAALRDGDSPQGEAALRDGASAQDGAMPGGAPAQGDDSEFSETKRTKKRRKTFIGASIAIVALAVGVLAFAFVAMGGVGKVKAERYCQLGERYLEELDYESAIAAFEAAIEIEPREDAYLGLAEAYVGLGDYASAIKALDEGVEKLNTMALIDYRDMVQKEWDDKTRKICGKVYAGDTDLDDSNNAGIPDIEVLVTGEDGETITCYTDEDGHFDSGILPSGKYTVSFSKDGYVGYEQEVEATGGGENNVDAYLEPDTEASLSGSVLIADKDMDFSNNKPLKGAKVSIEKLTGSNPYKDKVRTDANGRYELDGLRMGVYRLTISKKGFLTAEENISIYEGQSISYNTVIEMIDDELSGEGTASGTVYDALTGKGVKGMTLVLREGINNTQGEALQTFETNRRGKYKTPKLPSGNYCIEIQDNREGVEEKYIGSSINVKVLGGMNIKSQDGTVSTSIQSGQVRIVMSWGSNPGDLDSHLQCDLENGKSHHIFFADRTFRLDGKKIADLDLDDTDCYGPETTTIYSSDAGKYEFGVFNYTHAGSSELAESGACVQVYLSSSLVPSYVFYVPHEKGYYWDVFRYDSETGVLTPVNEMAEG